MRIEPGHRARSAAFKGAAAAALAAVRVGPCECCYQAPKTAPNSRQRTGEAPANTQTHKHKTRASAPPPAQISAPGSQDLSAGPSILCALSQLLEYDRDPWSCTTVPTWDPTRGIHGAQLQRPSLRADIAILGAEAQAAGAQGPP